MHDQRLEGYLIRSEQHDVYDTDEPRNLLATTAGGEPAAAQSNDARAAVNIIHHGKTGTVLRTAQQKCAGVVRRHCGSSSCA